jgi:hypothetical protein
VIALSCVLVHFAQREASEPWAGPAGASGSFQTSKRASGDCRQSVVFHFLTCWGDAGPPWRAFKLFFVALGTEGGFQAFGMAGRGLEGLCWMRGDDRPSAVVVPVFLATSKGCADRSGSSCRACCSKDLSTRDKGAACETDSPTFQCVLWFFRCSELVTWLLVVSPPLWSLRDMQIGPHQAAKPAF